MEKQSGKHINKPKRRKWPWIVMFAILLLVIGARLSLKSSFIHTIVKNQIVHLSGDMLNGQLAIGRVEGDLWKEIKLVDLSITTPDTLFKADTLYAGYRAMSYFYPPIQISQIKIDNPAVKLKEEPDGDLNLQRLVKEVPAEDTTAATAPFTFDIDRFAINGGTVDGQFRSLGEDSLVSIRSLDLEAGFAYQGDQFDLQLRELGFTVNQTRLSPVKVNTQGQATEQEITLEKLVIGTGRSVVQSTGMVNTADSTTSFNISADPLSWQDLATYLGPLPIQQNVQLDLGLSGTFREFEASLAIEANGLEQFNLSTDFSWDQTLSLQRAELNVQRLNLATLMSDSTYPDLQNLQFDTEGMLRFSEMDQAVLDGSFSADNIRQGSYVVDRAAGTYSIDGDQLTAGLQVNRAPEELQASVSISDIWSDLPQFTANLRASDLQPSYWLDDPTYQGRLNLTASIEGQGYELSDRFWDYELEVNDSEIAGQQLDHASFSGRVNQSRVTTNSEVRFHQSEFRLSAQVDDYVNAPAYQYELNIDRLNLAEYEGLEELPTQINAQITGQGRYTTPQQLQLTSTVQIDSSIINNEFIEELSAEIQVQDTVADVSNGRLRSAIADGSFDARLHLLNLYDIENRLNLDFLIKDIQSFAGVAGVEQLKMSGEIAGQMRPVYDDELEFTGSVDLKNFVYGDMLTTEAVQGSVDLLLVEQPEYTFNLSLSSPIVSSVVLQDFETTVKGTIAPDSTYGNIQLMFSSQSDNRLQHFATYGIGPNVTTIHTEDLQVISDLRRLSLSEPFDIIIRDQNFRMDTLRLESDDGAIMEAAVPHADSLDQRGYLMGQNLNMTVIQNTLLNESYFEGTLSGRVYVDRRDTVVSSSGELKIVDLVYRGTAMDSLDIRYELQDERLEGGLLLYDGGTQLVRGELRLPFGIGQSGSVMDDEEIEGFIDVREVATSRFQEFITSAGITNTSGLIRISSRLQGTVGNPQLDASFRMRDATVSGVAVDSVTATLDYNHGTHALTMNGSVTSLKQKAAEVAATVPIHLDLKNYSVSLPEGEDSIRVDITTNQFNVASLNDFVDHSEIREIQGRLDGQVAITGPMNDLSARGKFLFQQGAVRIVEAGVKISNISSTINFEDNTVELQQFRARSGNGNFTAKGTMNFDELRPGALDVSMVAENFRIANTDQYSATINMDTQLSGSLFNPDVDGSMSFVSGFIYLDNFGEKSVEAVDLDSTANDDYYFQYDSLSLDMDISFDNRFFVRNSRFLELEYELDGQVDLLKKRGEDIQLFGTLGASSGYSRPLGKRFQLEEGTITFSGEPTNPQLNVRHIFEPPQQRLGDIRIWYIIEGTVENPQFRYESEPPMGLEDIISYTLFGKPFLSLDPWKQVVANSGSNTSAADVAMDVLLDKVETLARQRLGIDVVQIDNTRSGSTTGTSIKTGWYLNPRVFFAIQNEIAGSSPDTIFILEYLLKKNLKLIITQGSDSQTGLDVRWNYDY